MRYLPRIAPLHPRLLKGFTLVELLAVIAIIVLLAMATGPAVSAIAGARGVNRTAYEISGLLEFARAEAVTRQTYVWVGFKNATNNGSQELQMAAVASRDGSGTNVASANLMSLGRIIRGKNVALSSWADLKTATRGLMPAGTKLSSLSASSDGISFQVGTNRFDTGKTITFTPRGEALLTGTSGPNDGYEPLIDVSFRQSWGSVVPPNADDAAILVDGATGAVRTLKL